MTAPTIETDLGKILERIEQNLAESRRETNQRFEQLQKDLTEIKIAQARFEAEVKGDFKALQGEVSTLKEDVRDIKGAQKAQIWSLIGILGTVVFGTIVRFVITAMPTANP
jgi:phosphoglycerate-specific signal transduction histidine kinase